MEEGVDLRQAKINCEILVLGAVPVWAVETAVKADLTIAIFSKEHLLACRQAYERTGIKPKVHVKLDTGMNRIGVSIKDAVVLLMKLETQIIWILVVCLRILQMLKLEKRHKFK